MVHFVMILHYIYSIGIEEHFMHDLRTDNMSGCLVRGEGNGLVRGEGNGRLRGEGNGCLRAEGNSLVRVKGPEWPG